MATLIQSKQIEGIVTSSIVHGEFLVSGSLIVTGSNSILGSVSASTISSSFYGDGSGITNITYSQIENTPQFVGGNNITITSSSNVITIHAQLDGTGSDAQSLSISGDQLTIIGGNTVTIPTGSTSWSQLGDIPSGLVSSSVQILGGSGILSGSKTDISSLNTFSSSIQSEVDALTAATSSYLTSSGSVDFSDVVNKPSGLVSSSTQITITESQISDLTHYTDSDVRTYIDSIGVVSGSYVESLPQGLISGSTFTDYSSSIQTELAGVRSDLINQFTNADNSLQSSITSLESYTSSIQSEVDSLTSATSSYLTEVPSGTVSGSQQVIDSLPSGVVSGSSQITISSSQITDLAHTQIPAGTISGSEQLPQGLISSSTQITITESQISDLTHYTDSDVQSYLDSLGVVSGSVVEELPSGVISGSTQVVDSLPSGVVSGSTQITITESQISDLSHTDISNLNTFTSSIQSEVDSLTAATSSYLTSIDSGIVSSSTQVTELLPSGVISGSSQITITESQISDLTHYTDSDVKSKLDAEGVVSGSVVREIPQGTISGSEQLPSGLVSGSTQITDGSGLISGSTQITDGSGIISSSVQVISHLPAGVVSGSTQITDGSGLISSSIQVISHLPSGIVSGSFSGSVATAIELLQEVSGANYIESSSAHSRLNTIEGSIGFYYDLSNTVWNNKYIKSGSSQASDTSGFQTGNVPFKFRLNDDRKLNYQVGDVVYISNFDRDTTITATVSSSYETGSREIGFTIVSVNQSDSVTRINDSYWIISRHTAGFVDSASYSEVSSSIDEQFKAIANAGAGADWNANLYNIPQGIISASVQLYSASIEAGIASTASLNSVSASLATTIENVYLSSSNFDNKTLVSGSSQIDLRNTTNYVSDEHIDHTTIVLTAGDGLDGGGDIASSRTFTLNVTSSHFEDGVKDVLTSEGVVKQSTLDTDIVGTDFSQSVDTRINAIVSTGTPAGTVSGSTQVDITQTENYTAFSSSIATSIANVGGGTSDFTQLTNVPSGLVSGSEQILGGSGILSGSHPISNLNSFTESIQSIVDTLVAATSSYLTSETDSQTLSIVGDQLTISSGNTITIPTGSELPNGLISSSQQISDLGFIDTAHTDTTQLNQFTSSYYTDSASLDSRISTLETATDLTGSDTQTLSIVGDQLTISGGNTITIPTGSSSSGGDVSFDGDRVISNTLLGDLYSQSFNAGTSGTVQDFLNALFFPSYAPTATFSTQTSNLNTNLGTENGVIETFTLTDEDNNTPYSVTLSGTDASSFKLVPQNAASSSWELQAATDLSAGTYTYDLTITDSNGDSVDYTGRSVTIAQADTGTLSTNGTLYIIESATSGVITLSSTGRPGSTGAVSVSYSPNYGSQAATNFTSSNPLISVNSSTGVLSVGSAISGSGNVGGDTITSTISWEDQYGNTDSSDININVTQNNAPSVGSTQVSNNNTNQARNTNLILQLTITDTEGDTIPNSGLVFSGYNTTYFSETITSPYMQLRANSTTVPAGTYPYTASLSDTHGFRTRVVSGSFTINTPDDGTNIGDSSIYIVESATSGDSFRDATGFGNGNAAQVVVSFSPNYGSQTVQSFTSSNPAISIDSSGYLTLGVDLSGSVTQSGDTLQSTITWTDQYSNTDSTTITATVFGNQSPSANFTATSEYDTDAAISGSTAGTLTVTDTESNSPFTIVLGGTDGGKFDIQGSSSPFTIQPTGSLEEGSYSINITVTDTYGESVTLTNETITVESAQELTTVYIYTSTRGATGITSANYNGILGITSEDTSTEPDLITGYQSIGPSPIYTFKTGDLGSSSITVGGGTMTLRAERSGSDLDSIISSSFAGSNGSEQFLIIWPSGSTLTSSPTSVTDSGGSTAGEYITYVKTAGESAFSAVATEIHMFDVDTAVDGYTRWNIIGRQGLHATTAYEVRLIPSSGSAPS